MQRYFVNSQSKEKITFSKEQTHHIVNVMRMKKDDKFYVVLATKQSGVVQITDIIDSDVFVRWVETENRSKELPINVTIACGLLKGDKFEWLTQKATELGVYAIVPLITDLSITKWDNKKATKKVERLQKIAQESAEQSHRIAIPKILVMHTVNQLVQSFKQYTHVLIAYEEDSKNDECHQFKKIVQTMNKGDSVLIIFGSEGGLSSKEIDMFLQSHAISCGLGPRIMRAETAPLYTLSAISYEFELN